MKYYILVYPDDLAAKVFKHDGEKLGKAAESDSEIFSFDEATCPFTFGFSTVFKHFRN
ncbi:MAG: hypothetical protein V3V31_00170 [Methylococcales bacterium]